MHQVRQRMVVSDTLIHRQAQKQLARTAIDHIIGTTKKSTNRRHPHQPKQRTFAKATNIAHIRVCVRLCHANHMITGRIYFVLRAMARAVSIAIAIVCERHVTATILHLRHHVHITTRMVIKRQKVAALAHPYDRYQFNRVQHISLHHRRHRLNWKVEIKTHSLRSDKCRRMELWREKNNYWIKKTEQTKMNKTNQMILIPYWKNIYEYCCYTACWYNEIRTKIKIF